MLICYDCVGFVVVILVTVYFWLKRRRRTTWKDQNVLEIASDSWLSTIRRVLKGPLFLTDYQDYQKYGPIYGLYELNIPKLIVNDLEIFKQITAKDFHIFPQRFDLTFWDVKMGKNLLFLKGHEWKNGRKVVTPIFSSGKLKKMYYLMEKCSNEVLDALCANKDDVNLKDFWGCYTLNVIARCCFATDVNAYTDEKSSFVLHAKRFFSQRMWRAPLTMVFPPWLSRLLGLGICPKDTRDFYVDALSHIIESRRSGTDNLVTQVDMLKLLTDVCEEAKKIDQSEDSNRLFDDDFVISQSILFFLAGYETTATLLMLASHVLATRADIQTKLCEQVRKIQGPDGSIDYDSLMGCKYLDAFIFEVLRLYPPVVRIERTASEDYVIPQNGIKIPKGGVVSFSPYAFHRNSEHFSDPDQLNPDRFLANDTDEDLTHRVISFGAGPRSCVAMRFALLESKLALAKSVLKFEFVKTNNTAESIEFVNGFDLMKTRPLVISFIRREK